MQCVECVGGGVAGWRWRPREARGDGDLGHCRDRVCMMCLTEHRGTMKKTDGGRDRDK